MTALGTLLIVSACSTPDEATSDLHLVVVQAPDAGAAGATTAPVIVRVVDGSDRPQSGVPVTWSVMGGEGTITPAADTSGLDGLAAAQWRLGFAGGENTLAVSIYDEPALTISMNGQVFHAEQVTVTYGRACGVSNGELWCWSTSYGDRRPIPRLGPFKVVQAALTGSLDVCALDREGIVRCQSSFSGQPGDFYLINSLPPLASISASDRYACGVSATDATPWCWELSAYWPAPPPTAHQVSSSLRLASVSAGGGSAFACGVAEDSTAWCWGSGFQGTLGNGTFESSTEPVPVSGGLRFRQTVAGDGFACGVTLPNAFYCWGQAQYGLGNSQSNVPEPVEGLAAASASANSDGVIVLSSGGNADVWGAAYNSRRRSLRSLPEFSGIPIIAASAGNFPCVIASDRSVYCLYSDAEDAAFYWKPVPLPSADEVTP